MTLNEDTYVTEQEASDYISKYYPRLDKSLVSTKQVLFFIIKKIVSI